MYVVVPDHDQENRKKYVCSTSIQQEKTVFRCKYCKKDGPKVEKCSSLKKLDIDKRWDWARDNKVCFTCLGSSHHTKYCKSKKKCDINGCLFKHNPLLHKEPETKSEDIEEKVNYHTNTEVFLRMAPVELSGPEGKVDTYALFDETSSTIIMIDAKVAHEIGANGLSEALEIKCTNSMTSEKTVESLSLPVQSVEMKRISQKFNYLQKIKISSLVDVQPRSLIGQDNIDLIIACFVQIQTRMGFTWKHRQRNIAVTELKSDPKTEMHNVFCGGVGEYVEETHAQFGMRKNAAEFEQAFPEAFKATTERHYVDDFLG
ncbi:hypothetical protein JTB14_000773 [Gonioctena quinquepunctata]|nr:hypothetical protein JTB14_000773 [Gonioctena quinquepunctata]